MELSLTYDSLELYALSDQERGTTAALPEKKSIGLKGDL
jgi:hypothetical protein